jgi:ribonuclease HII
MLMPAKRTRGQPPTLEVEASLWRTGIETVGGMDEVGRGAWAGPVVVCAAGLRALAKLSSPPEIVILDGGEDYMTARQDPDASDDVAHLLTIRTEVKGDVRCAAVTAASVLAKTYRDQYMQNLANQSPEYGWQRNAGYHTAEHLAAYTTYGPSMHHRRGWGIAGSSDLRRQDQATNRTAEDTSSA